MIPSPPPSPSSPASLLSTDVADNRDPNRCYCCHSVCGMASRKKFMGHMNRRHRDMSAAHITALMQQRFAILDCHCGHHCISRTGLLMHLSRYQVPRPDGWNIPPHHPLHHDEPLPQLAHYLFLESQSSRKSSTMKTCCACFANQSIKSITRGRHQ